MLGMSRALAALALAPELALIDGNRLPKQLRCPARAVIGGDASEPAISAASILAKVARDRFMTALDDVHPGYGFARHKRYPTPEHLECLTRLGPCAQHRRSFAPGEPCSSPNCSHSDTPTPFAVFPARCIRFRRDSVLPPLRGGAASCIEQQGRTCHLLAAAAAFAAAAPSAASGLPATQLAAIHVAETVDPETLRTRRCRIGRASSRRNRLHSVHCRARPKHSKSCPASSRRSTAATARPTSISCAASTSITAPIFATVDRRRAEQPAHARSRPGLQRSQRPDSRTGRLASNTAKAPTTPRTATSPRQAPYVSATRSRLDQDFFALSGGEHGYRARSGRRFWRRSLAAAGWAPPTSAPTTARGRNPQDARKASLLLRYRRGDAERGLHVSLAAYDSRWDATDQIPQRAVAQAARRPPGPARSGSRRRYVTTDRCRALCTRRSARSQLLIDAYAAHYDLRLFSNFTYFLADPERGDEFEQRDARNVLPAAR